MNAIDPAHLPTTTLSPFLPGTNIQYAWDSTSLGYLKTCPRLYQYIMIEGWGETDESIHLRFGIELHKAVEDYEHTRAEGSSHEDAIRVVVLALLQRTVEWKVDESTRAGKYKNRHSLIRTVIDYYDHYKQDAAETYILADGRPAVELSFRFELGWGPSQQKHEGDPGPQPGGWAVQPYLLCGHLDRVVTFNDALFVVDHKTTTSTPGQYYFDQFHPNNQMTLYTLASRVILKAPIRGVIIDACQILTYSSAFQRGFTYRTPDQLDEWQSDLQSFFAMAEAYANANYWPMNDTACDKFGGCRFRKICQKDPRVREQFLKTHFTKLAPEERWNPLKPR